MSHAQSRQEVRYAELDALRGLAAMVVVIGHFQHLFSVKVSPLSYLLFRTPINILFAGHEAVILFFLLSGYVLSLPFLRAPQSYPVFVVRRVFRIYLPYLAALGLAIAGAYFFHGTIPALGQWFNLTWSQTPSVHGIVQHIAFLGVYDAAQFNTAFWSLIYEGRISLIFPLVFWLTRKVGLLSLVVSLGFTVLANSLAREANLADLGVTVHITGIFILGSLLAGNMFKIRAAYGRAALWAKNCLSLLVALVLTYGSMIRLSGFWHDWEVAFCATWLVVTALCSESFRRFLLGRMPQFLGRISYSLYLVHGTVLFALVHLLYGKVRLIAILPLYLPLAITMAVLLHKLVEAPSMEVGRRVGYWLGPRLLPAPARVPAD